MQCYMLIHKQAEINKRTNEIQQIQIPVAAFLLTEIISCFLKEKSPLIFSLDLFLQNNKHIYYGQPFPVHLACLKRSI